MACPSWEEQCKHGRTILTSLYRTKLLNHSFQSHILAIKLNRFVGFRNKTAYNTSGIGMMGWHYIIKNSLVHFRSASEYIPSSTKKNANSIYPQVHLKNSLCQQCSGCGRHGCLDGDGYLDCQLDRVEKSLDD